MPRLFTRYTPFAAVLMVGLLLAGCENQLEAPATITLQTRSAAEVLPAEARFVGMMNLSAMQHNATFNPLGDMSGEAGARVRDFIERTGFDPATDLQEVYFAASTMDARARPSFVAYATYDRERLLDYVEQNMRDTFERSDYRGVPVYRATQDDHTFAFALATGNMIVGAFDASTLETMLDRLSNGGHALKDNAETMALIAQTAAGSSAWFIARDITAQLPDAPPQHTPPQPEEAMAHTALQIGKALRDVVLSVTLQDDGAEGTVLMTTKDGVSATDVADLTQGIVAAMKASSDVDDAQLRMLDEVQVRSKGDQVRVNFYLDNATLKSTGY